MNGPRSAICLLAVLAMGERAAGDAIDRLDSALSVSALNDQFRARLSGTLDLEDYHFSQPAPGVIDAEGANLFNPRLTLFLDAQMGTQVYVFAQARADHGFDPNDEKSLTARLDEYAVRFSPGTDGRFNLQVGKFATVVGNWVPRHGSWDNAFVTAPLPYENLTGIWDAEAARSSAMVLYWARVVPPRQVAGYEEDKYRQLPIIWGPSYTTGAAAFGEIGEMTYAAEVKNGSLSSRPGVWDDAGQLWRDPTVSGRLGWQPNEMWSLGVSASSGTYLQESAEPTVPAGRSRSDYRETVLAQDLGFAWHHVQAWAEFYEARFAIPGVGDADTLAYYTELKYRVAPQLALAVRWNQQFFSDFPDGAGGRVPWSPEKWRIDFAPAYRFTPHVQLKVQYSLEHDAVGPRRLSHLVAAQLTLRF
ncbi:MAG TPA: hypothetical protein VG710_02100 [Opitutus sp.]|nr:hypothetical protein [Opitutus sp.]